MQTYEQILVLICVRHCVKCFTYYVTRFHFHYHFVYVQSFYSISYTLYLSNNSMYLGGWGETIMNKGVCQHLESP